MMAKFYQLVGFISFWAFIIYNAPFNCTGQ